MKIDTFGVEIWMNSHENDCRWNLAETCVDSLTVGELLDLASTSSDAVFDALSGLRLTYGAIEGSQRLRTAIAGLYETRKADETIVAHGAAGANALVYSALIEPGDRVISFVPTYQQHVSIPESLGAQVETLALREEDGFAPDLDALRQLAQDGVKLIVFSNPNNPTGALMERAVLEEIVAIADSCGAWVLSDEVYRGLDRIGDGTTASVTDLYDKGISIGSMSKAFSLAGLRLGWIAARTDLIERVSIHRDYNTISVGMIDDLFAAIALESRDAILKRNRAIVAENLSILTKWVAAEPSISWTRPRGGTVTLLKYAAAMPSEEFCLKLLAETGVLFTPGSALGVEGTVRIGYANSTDVLCAGLAETSRFLASLR